MSDTGSFSTAREVMEAYHLFPKKNFGQNFLVDKNILKKIADSCDITSEDYLVEIGPGLGALTQELAQRCQGVLAIDIDQMLEPVLRNLADEYKNIELYFQDILDVDLEAILAQKFDLKGPVSYKVCANIPYNITTPIIFKLLEDCPHMASATLMMQKEVSTRLLAKPNNKDYGRLTLTTQYYANVEHVMNVSRNCFYPKPEVDSAVVRIIPVEGNKVNIKNEEMFKAFLRTAFSKRRKTILNISAGFFNKPKPEMEIILQQIGIASNLRPENLSIETYADLINSF